MNMFMNKALVHEQNHHQDHQNHHQDQHQDQQNHRQGYQDHPRVVLVVLGVVLMVLVVALVVLYQESICTVQAESLITKNQSVQYKHSLSTPHLSEIPTVPLRGLGVDLGLT